MRKLRWGGLLLLLVWVAWLGRLLWLNLQVFSYLNGSALVLGLLHLGSLLLGFGLTVRHYPPVSNAKPWLLVTLPLLVLLHLYWEKVMVILSGMVHWAWTLAYLLTFFIGVLAAIGVIQIRLRYRNNKRLPVTLVLLVVVFIGVEFAHLGITYYPAQKRYFDPVVFSDRTRTQQVDVTTWRNQYWYYQDQRLRFSSVDRALFFEPMVHPAKALAPSNPRVLIIGGEDGCALRELVKYSDIKEIQHLPLDGSMARLAAKHPLWTSINHNAFQDNRLIPITGDPFQVLSSNQGRFDLILIDVGDPINAIQNQYYTYEFYAQCLKALNDRGILISQAGSPYFATTAYQCIDLTMEAAGFNTLRMHNQVPTMGEWGWIIGAPHLSDHEMKLHLKEHRDFPEMEWLTVEAVDLLVSFGKNYWSVTSDALQLNTLDNPELIEYYQQGNWKI